MSDKWEQTFMVALRKMARKDRMTFAFCSQAT